MNITLSNTWVHLNAQYLPFEIFVVLQVGLVALNVIGEEVFDNPDVSPEV